MASEHIGRSLLRCSPLRRTQRQKFVPVRWEHFGLDQALMASTSKRNIDEQFTNEYAFAYRSSVKHQRDSHGFGNMEEQLMLRPIFKQPYMSSIDVTFTSVRL